MSLIDRSSSNNTRIYVKQSYIMLAWMAYIREVQTVRDYTKTKDKDDSLNSESYPSFFIYPCRLTKRTFLKAPMAHKTFSQEQFKMKFYTLGISFDNSIRSTSAVPGINESVYLSLTIRSNQTPFESNLFFLKQFHITCTDASYMKLF